MKRHYRKQELIKLHTAAVLLALNGLITDGELQKIKGRLLKLTPQSRDVNAYCVNCKSEPCKCHLIPTI